MGEERNRICKWLWEEVSEEELRLMELEEQCTRLRNRVLEIAKGLSDDQRIAIEGYIYSEAEWEMYSLFQAYEQGRKSEEMDKNRHKPLY